jgi:hypothetical protein
MRLGCEEVPLMCVSLGPTTIPTPFERLSEHASGPTLRRRWTREARDNHRAELQVEAGISCNPRASHGRLRHVIG